MVSCARIVLLEWRMPPCLVASQHVRRPISRWRSFHRHSTERHSDLTQMVHNRGSVIDSVMPRDTVCLAWVLIRPRKGYPSCAGSQTDMNFTGRKRETTLSLVSTRTYERKSQSLAFPHCSVSARPAAATDCHDRSWATIISRPRLSSHVPTSKPGPVNRISNSQVIANLYYSQMTDAIEAYTGGGRNSGP
jgi:hypothetical protein